MTAALLPVAVEVANDIPNDYAVREFVYLVERAWQLNPYWD